MTAPPVLARLRLDEVQAEQLGGWRAAVDVLLC